MQTLKIIADTSCLIALRNIGRLDILRELYGFVTITPEVAAEYGEILPEWVSVVAVEDNCKTRLIGRTLDLGEASTIALAMESREALLILDDGKARCFAKNLGMSLTGTLGVMAKAYRAGYIDDLTEVINDFRRCGFYIPNDIEHELLRRE